LKAGREFAFADGSFSPGCDRLWIISEELDDSGEVAELCVDPSFAILVTPLVLLQG
jgi:hypothetical protein